MVDEASDDAKAALATQIASIVNETFAIRRQVVLLSYLGQALRKRGLDFREILGEQKLVEFIKERLAEQIKLVSTPAGPLVLAAVPFDIDVQNEIDPFGTSRKPPQLGSAGHHKRELLVREVWFAFSHALESGKARVLRLEPTIEYEDYDPSTGEKPQGFDVSSEQIVPSGSFARAKRDELIYENVQSWAAQNGVPFRSLIEGQVVGSSRGRNTLDLLLASLSESDLSRITLPLDVVAKLRRKQH